MAVVIVSFDAVMLTVSAYMLSLHKGLDSEFTVSFFGFDWEQTVV